MFDLNSFGMVGDSGVARSGRDACSWVKAGCSLEPLAKRHFVTDNVVVKGSTDRLAKDDF